MKKLHLIRHAKSSWDHPGLNDIDRPLNKRGFKASKIMAQPIIDAGCGFEAVFSSPAKRAQETIENIASHLPGRHIRWETDQSLYTFSAGCLLDWCQDLDDDLSEVTIVGHNPAITELTNRLTGTDILNVPTCGYIQMEFDGNWKDLNTGNVKFVTFLTPKMLREE